jgi:hypothetical protein
MTRQEYDRLPSDGKQPCPDCGSRQTKPYPCCNCPPNPKGIGTMHINEYHHECEASDKVEGAKR